MLATFTIYIYCIYDVCVKPRLPCELSVIGNAKTQLGSYSLYGDKKKQSKPQQLKSHTKREQIPPPQYLLRQSMIILNLYMYNKIFIKIIGYRLNHRM